jgi:acyl-coenzyme A thioesterase PaaI-like protein
MDEHSAPSLQERFAPAGRCFGCGPANRDGLRIRSFEGDDDTIVADWTARPEHEAFDGFVNGGILGTLVDCHSNWAAIAHLMRRHGGTDTPAGDTLAGDAPSTVTAELSIRYLHPTPSDRPVRLVAHVVASSERSVTVETSVESDGRATAVGRAVFVVVGAGHPAHDRWRGEPLRPGTTGAAG